ncbi:MAG: hypothetical protein M1816_002144 [Peltula sp. TS41687]|nr:MAG: hypothetical protein M1816_002144 [Peltula sp. TS41687]
MQILVHISAASGAQDDARYRAQAAGYLTFEKISSSPKDIASSPRQIREPFFAREDLRDFLDLAGTDTWAQSGHDVHSSSESNSRNGELSTSRKRPRLSGTMMTPRKRQAIVATPLPSTRHVSSSQPTTGGYEHSSPEEEESHVTAAAEFFFPQLSPPNNRRTNNNNDNNNRPLNIEKTPHSWQTPPSIVPDSQPSRTSRRTSIRRSISLPAAPPTPSPHLPNTQAAAAATAITQPAPFPEPHPNPSYEISTQNPPASLPLLLVPPPPPPPAPPPTNTLPSSPRPTPNPTPPFLKSQSKAIHPPHAATGLHPAPTSATTLLTPSLLLLDKTLSLEKRFQQRIKRQTRPLAPFERGYWHVDVSSFSAESRARFWSFLQDFVGRGKAGWGVWVDGDGEEEEEEDEEGGQQRGDVMDDGLRVFCWGGIVGHVWLMLWLGSERRIIRARGVAEGGGKGEGPRWVDAVGEVVVEMG